MPRTEMQDAMAWLMSNVEYTWNILATSARRERSIRKWVMAMRRGLQWSGMDAKRRNARQKGLSRKPAHHSRTYRLAA